jgi:hypothetical protein
MLYVLHSHVHRAIETQDVCRRAYRQCASSDVRNTCNELSAIDTPLHSGVEDETCAGNESCCAICVAVAVRVSLLHAGERR